jgi:glutamate-1-semialdehyde aminotransferase
MYKEFKHLVLSSRILKKCTTSILSKCLLDEGSDSFPAIKRGKGPYLYDYDGNRYVDFSLDRGSLNLGHSDPRVTTILKSWLGRGFGADPLTASLSASHETLSKKLWETIWEKGDEPDIGKWTFIYSASPFEALFSAIDLLREGGGGKVTYARTGSQSRIASRLSRIFQTNESTVSPTDAGLRDFVILRPPLGGEKETEHAVERKSARETVFLSDETELLFHASMRSRPGLTSRIDGRIVGSWAAAGLPFGCAVVKTSLVDRPATVEHVLPLAGSLPLCLAKAAARSIDLRERLGGIAGLLAKHREFFAALDGRFFEIREDTVFMRENETTLGRYRELRERLLRKGILFPVSPFEPLSLSYAHEGELLVKCARQIGLLFDIFYR